MTAKEQGLPEPHYRVGDLLPDRADTDLYGPDIRAALVSDTGERGVVTEAMVGAALMARYGDGDVSDMLAGGGDEEYPIMHAALTAALRAQPAGGGEDDPTFAEIEWAAKVMAKARNMPPISATPPESGGQGEAVAWTWPLYKYQPRDQWALANRKPPENFVPDARPLFDHPPAQASELAGEYTRGRNDGWEAAEQKFRAAAQASGAVTEALIVAKRIYYMRRDFDLSTVERTRFWARECRDIVEALAQGGGNER